MPKGHASLNSFSKNIYLLTRTGRCRRRCKFFTYVRNEIFIVPVQFDNLEYISNSGHGNQPLLTEKTNVIRLHKERANPDLKLTCSNGCLRDSLQAIERCGGDGINAMAGCNDREQPLHYVRLAARVKHLGKGFDFFVRAGLLGWRFA